MALSLLTASALPAGCEREEGVRLIAPNIGKADCLLLLWADQAYLIDAGYEHTYPALEAMLAQYGVTRLNGVFLTHCHKDHYGGLIPLSKSRITVDAWYAPELYTEIKNDAHPARLAAANKGTPVTWLKAGDVIPAGESSSFTVLGPVMLSEENENDNSLVLRFVCPEGSVLLAGDMKEDEEYDLLSAGAFSKTDVLKVGHHGDGKASTLKMLRQVAPKLSLIATDSREESDTPARGTLTRLAATGSQVYVTQDCHDAWEITLKDGVPTAADIQWNGAPAKAESITLAMNLKDDSVTLKNGGDTAFSLAGCVLYSSKGDETLTLPGGEIAPGGSYTIGTRSSKNACDYTWSAKKVWHQKKYDMAIFYDSLGRPLAFADNGKPE